MFGLLCRVLTSREKVHRPDLDQTIHISVIFLVICSFFIYKFYPFVEAIIDAKASVIDLPLNWEILFKEKISNRASEYAWSGLKFYLPPIVCTIVWFFYFSKSKWIAERITPKTTFPR